MGLFLEVFNISGGCNFLFCLFAQLTVPRPSPDRHNGLEIKKIWRRLPDDHKW